MIDIEGLMDDCVDALADDNMQIGVDCLMELRLAWCKAGIPESSYNDMRTYLINEAKKRDQCPVLIDTKLELAEQNLRKSRNGTALYN